MTTLSESPTDLMIKLDELFIGGSWVSASSNATFPVVNPATAQVVAQVASPSRADADAAVAAARKVHDSGVWSSMSVDERVAAVSRWCDNMEAEFPRLNAAWALESGAPLAYGALLNDGAARAIWRHVLEIAPTIDWIEQRDSVLLERVATGVTLIICTYNGPVTLMGRDVIPALVAGCPVIVKHAPESALTSRIIAQCASDAGLPDGVLSFLPAETEVTQYLVGHEGVDMVALTGGVPHGKDVVQRAGSHLARTVLELGGKSPAIILDDANLDDVIPTLGDASCTFLGQVCLALTRVLVTEEMHDEVVRRLAEYYESLRIGDPFDPETQLGPLAVKRALDRTEQYLASAVADGATIVTGGKKPAGFDEGWYFEPTLLTNVTNDMQVARDEIFGPIVVVIKYTDEADAIAIANDTEFGLAASVYSSDHERAMRVARRLQSGSVGVNTAGVSLTEPFGGVKSSGWGRMCGTEGILEFTAIKQVLVNQGGSYLGG
ncbi:aldehyde dehydrogenase [Rhodococcus rhodochrous]|nr:aldehyde dehydrogenase [Rhodococcus rhodochrous]